MKAKHYLILLVIVLAALGISWYVLQSLEAPVAPPPAPPSGGNAVKMVNFSFQPAVMTIKVGDTVTWTNEDTSRHDVTSDTGSELASELLAKGDSFTHTFAKAGEYTYHCQPHANMKGKIIVTE